MVAVEHKSIIKNISFPNLVDSQIGGFIPNPNMEFSSHCWPLLSSLNIHGPSEKIYWFQDLLVILAKIPLPFYYQNHTDLFAHPFWAYLHYYLKRNGKQVEAVNTFSRSCH